MQHLSSRSGFLTLISLLIVGAIGVVTAVTLLVLGLSSAQTSLVVEQSAQARRIVNTCAERALLNIKQSNQFQGGEIFVIDSGSCEYQVTNAGGENRVITATGTLQNVVRKLRVVVNQLAPRVNILSWEEVP